MVNLEDNPEGASSASIYILAAWRATKSRVKYFMGSKDIPPKPLHIITERTVKVAFNHGQRDITTCIKASPVLDELNVLQDVSRATFLSTVLLSVPRL